MTRALTTLLTAVVALGTTRWLLVASIPRAPLRRANYRGVRVATGLGVVAMAGVVAGILPAAFVASLRPRSLPLHVWVRVGEAMLTAALGFAMLGLWDDLHGAAGWTERGFKGHLGALREGRLTGGALKLLAGTALAFSIPAVGGEGFVWTLVAGATIALMANLFNSFDLRPGRALKMFLLAIVPMTILSDGAGVAAGAALGAALAFLPEDLRERAMLGDAGAYAFGALLGVGVYASEPPAWTRLVVLGVVLVLTIVADRPGLSAVIARTPGLRAFDRAWRVEEDEPAVLEQASSLG